MVLTLDELSPSHLDDKSCFRLKSVSKSINPCKFLAVHDDASEVEQWQAKCTRVNIIQFAADGAGAPSSTFELVNTTEVRGFESKLERQLTRSSIVHSHQMIHGWNDGVGKKRFQFPRMSNWERHVS